MKTKIIFFGNGPHSDYAKAVLAEHFEIIFHARTKEDLEKVKQLKSADSSTKGILASFGVIIKNDVLELFEPEGILNIHPSMLPKYRGASPIETAILNGDQNFGVSIMKLVKAMDAGPIYHQESFTFDAMSEKDDVYKRLATAGAKWLTENINDLPRPIGQDDQKATYTAKLDKSMSELKPETKSAEELLNEVRAFKGFPKSKYSFYGLDCIILRAHVSENEDNGLAIYCSDGKFLIVDEIQPAGRKPMDAKSFLNGYAKK